MWTCKRLDLQTLGSRLAMLKNLPNHCPWGWGGGRTPLSKGSRSPCNQPTTFEDKLSTRGNNSMTQLLSMLHTFKLHQMHCSISNNNIHCKMKYGCSNMFLSHDWVTPSRTLLLVISSSFPRSSHVSTILMSMHWVAPPYACVNG